MNRIVLVSLLGLALSAAAFAEDADKAWDLSLESKHAVGEKFDSVKTSTMRTTMKMSQDGKVMKEDAKTEAGSYEFTCETTAVDGGEMTGAKWTFRKAARPVDGKEEAWGFEGKTVVGKVGDGGAWEYACEDGSALSPEELKAVKDATGKKKEKSADEPEMDECLRPGKPVKVGESWKPDLAVIAKSFGGDKMKVDAEDSKAVCTLKSVETRDGVPYGRIAVDLDLSVVAIPPIQFNEPFHFVISIEMDVCIDGSRPDGRMAVTMKLEGTRKAKMKQGKQDLAFDMELGMDGAMSETRKAAK